MIIDSATGSGAKNNFVPLSNPGAADHHGFNGTKTSSNAHVSHASASAIASPYTLPKGWLKWNIRKFHSLLEEDRHQLIMLI